MSNTFHVEDLIGKAVHDAGGRKVGHIFEMVAEERDGELQILEYHLGKGAVLERLSASVRNMFGIRDREPIRIPWEALDLSDLERPRLVAVERMERAV
jgi:hypothetical protein